MKTATAIVCACLVLGAAQVAGAQEKSSSSTTAKITAGGAEDRALIAIKAESDPEKKAALVQEFEKNMPQSAIWPNAYTHIANFYLQRNDTKRMIEFGAKLFKLDPKNMSALLALSRGHALSENRNLEKAQEFASLAVAVLEELRVKPPQGGFSEQEWKDWIRQNDESVKPWVEYVKALQQPPPAAADAN